MKEQTPHSKDLVQCTGCGAQVRVVRLAVHDSRCLPSKRRSWSACPACDAWVQDIENHGRKCPRRGKVECPRCGEWVPDIKKHRKVLCRPKGEVPAWSGGSIWLYSGSMPRRKRR